MKGERWLDTKEAAKFLGVSEASIRRWSNAGTLPCNRIGGRKERRFTKDSLLLFLQAGPVSPSLPQAGQDFMTIEGTAIPLGSHLCNLYSSDEGRTRLAIPFLKAGLESDQTCFLVAADKDQSRFLRELESEGVDVKKALKKHQLILSSGFSGADQGLAYFDRAFAKALRSKPSHIRLVGDMVWGLKKMRSVKEFMDFETRYNLLAKRFPQVTICQYDVRKLDGITLLHVLKSHTDVFDCHLGMFLN